MVVLDSREHFFTFGLPPGLALNTAHRAPPLFFGYGNGDKTVKSLTCQERERGKKEKMARIVGANYTDEASLKHTYRLITVD